MKSSIIPPKYEHTRLGNLIPIVTGITVTILVAISLIPTIQNAPLSDRNEVPPDLVRVLWMQLIPILFALIAIVIVFFSLNHMEHKMEEEENS